MNAPDSDRWLPIFWAIDQFKNSQARDLQEGDWTLGDVEESKVPPPHKAAIEFKRAMDNWDESAADAAATAEMLTALRQAGDAEACKKAVELLNRGVGPHSIRDAFFEFASELLMRNPGIQSLHSVTTTNALQYAFHHCVNEDVRKLILLQNAAFLVQFRHNVLGQGKQSVPLIDVFESAVPQSAGNAAVTEIFADISRDRMLAARKALNWLHSAGDPKPFIDAAQRLIYLKGNDSHDYKFSSAVFEDYYHTSPRLRDRCLAASVFWLKGSAEPDTDLSKRIRNALSNFDA